MIERPSASQLSYVLNQSVLQRGIDGTALFLLDERAAALNVLTRDLEAIRGISSITARGQSLSRGLNAGLVIRDFLRMPEFAAQRGVFINNNTGSAVDRAVGANRREFTEYDQTRLGLISLLVTHTDEKSFHMLMNGVPRLREELFSIFDEPRLTDTNLSALARRYDTKRVLANLRTRMRPYIADAQTTRIPAVRIA